MSNIETYEGYPITFEKKDGKMMVNATQMAKPFEGKTVTHWLSNNQTTELIAYKSADSGIPTSELVVVIKGGEPSLQGTWLHEDLALPFAQWLSPKFYIWCNDHIKELLTTGSTSLNLPTDYLSALKALVKSEEEKQALALENKVMKPKAAYCDKVLTSQSTFTTTQVAKGYGISSAMKLNKMLKDHHIMFKQSGQWMPTSDYASKPYWEETTATISLGDDKVHTKKYYKWTELGIKWLREKFGFERYFDYNLAHNDYSDEE